MKWRGFLRILPLTLGVGFLSCGTHPVAKNGLLKSTSLETALQKAAKAIAPKLSGKVCVADFSDLTDLERTSEFGQRVADLLSDGLVNAENRAFDVVERRELIKIMQDSLLLIGDDSEAFARIQKHAGMDILVSGSYSAAGGEVALVVKAVAAATGKLLASEPVRVQVTPAIRKMLARQFRPSGSGEADDPPSRSADLLELEVGVFFEGGDGKLYPIREGMVLNSKDNYTVYIRPKKPSYVYIYQVDSSRKAFKLFPNPDLSKAENPVQPGEYWIPDDGGFLFLDNNVGIEQLYIFATMAPAPGLERIKEARFADIQSAIRTMGVQGKRGSNIVVKVKGTEGNAVDLVMRKLAADGDFFYKLSFIHQ